ncbi:MAG: hypothetical protein WC783_00145 [Candidatus Paceibacterota bacterium]|jgi:hypothetical protein
MTTNESVIKFIEHNVSNYVNIINANEATIRGLESEIMECQENLSELQNKRIVINMIENGELREKDNPDGLYENVWEMLIDEMWGYSVEDIIGLLRKRGYIY